MISDCLHHVYEALRCFEKRKYIVGFNLLRKPLKESLLYLAWMHGKRDEFYEKFTKGDPDDISWENLGNKRKEIYSDALRNRKFGKLFDPAFIEFTINSRKNKGGFNNLFQHAVHLVTTYHEELKTSAENFNFIFKNPCDDDIYDFLYQNLPYILLFMSHIIMGIFNQTKKMDETSMHLFLIRSKLSFNLIVEPDKSCALSNLRNLFLVPLVAPSVLKNVILRYIMRLGCC